MFVAVLHFMFHPIPGFPFSPMSLHDRIPASHPKLCTQGALGTGDLALLAGHLARGNAHRHGQRLEGRLGTVVVVEAAQAVDVQRDARALGKALHAVGDHLAAQVANLFALEAQLDDGVGTVRDVDNGARQGLVQGGIGRAEAGNPGRAAEGLVEGVAERNAYILCGVVVIDYWVSIITVSVW